MAAEAHLLTSNDQLVIIRLLCILRQLVGLWECPLPTAQHGW